MEDIQVTIEHHYMSNFHLFFILLCYDKGKDLLKKQIPNILLLVVNPLVVTQILDLRTVFHLVVDLLIADKILTGEALLERSFV